MIFKESIEYVKFFYRTSIELSITIEIAMENSVILKNLWNMQSFLQNIYSFYRTFYIKLQNAL